jgi:hypothetical protein
MSGHDLALDGDSDDDEAFAPITYLADSSQRTVQVLEARARDHCTTRACTVPWPVSIRVAAGLSKRAGRWSTKTRPPCMSWRQNSAVSAERIRQIEGILVLGPDSSLAALILAVVLPLSAGDPLRAIALASMMAVVSGVLCILAGVARLGFVTELLSKPIRYGYMNGIALTVLISQLPKLFGFPVAADDPLHKVWQFGQALLAGKTQRDRLSCSASPPSP